MASRSVDDIETELNAVKMKFDRLEQQIDNAEQVLTAKGVPLDKCLELLCSDKLRLKSTPKSRYLENGHQRNGLLQRLNLVSVPSGSVC